MMSPARCAVSLFGATRTISIVASITASGCGSSCASVATKRSFCHRRLAGGAQLHTEHPRRNLAANVERSVYLVSRSRFLSPAAIPAFSPHQSTCPGGQLKDFNSSPSPSSPPPITAPMCPTCGSAATVTAAATPSAESYWRCTKCGDVWNVSRMQTNRSATGRWR
jgi:hypothetical protein